jgi:NAD(P)-dependent dehydrogenase (short-subunit alcohol dehydrogenase family)
MGYGRLVTPIMAARGDGSMVTATICAALEPPLWFPAACVYRAGLSAIARLRASRYGPQSIGMKCLLPGFTDNLDVAKHGDLAAPKCIARAEDRSRPPPSRVVTKLTGPFF